MGHFKAWKDGESLDRIYLGSEFLTLNFRLMEQVEYDYITAHDSFTLKPKRERGKYRHCSAEAVLDHRPNEGGYSLVMRFKRPQDGVLLYELIRAGQIRPYLSYNGEQIAWPPRHIKDMLREVWSIIRRKLSDLKYRFEQFEAN